MSAGDNSIDRAAATIRLGLDLRFYPQKQETTCAHNSALTFCAAAFFNSRGGRRAEYTRSLSISVPLRLTFPLSEEKHTRAPSHPLPPILASQAGRGTMKKHFFFCTVLFFVSNTIPPFVSHHTIFNAATPAPQPLHNHPQSFLALNDTVYTHPASIIPFHTSPGLFISLG